LRLCLEINSSHGPQLKTAISAYIGTIPLEIDPPRIRVGTAVIAKVGAERERTADLVYFHDALPYRIVQIPS
jgi:hypothetical protein